MRRHLSDHERARQWLARASFLLALVCPALIHAEPIKEILVEENTKTTDDTVMFIAEIKVGDEFTPGMEQQIQEKLVSSDLFKDVSVAHQPVAGGVRLIITAKDKHSWVVAPTYYDQPTNKGGGLGFGENNLFGENKKLLLYGQVATGDSFFVGAYVDPSVGGTFLRWQVDTYLLRERAIEYKPPDALRSQPQELRISKRTYLNMGLKIGATLTRGTTFDVRIRGAKVSFEDTQLAEGANIADVTGNPTTPLDQIPPPGPDGYDVSGEVMFEYDRRANWYGITHGNRYRLSYERALPQVGSDFEYWYTTFRYERARKYLERHNLVFKSIIGYGHNLPFQQEYVSGGTDLRGYKNEQFRGDFRLGMNLEYSVPVITVKGVALRLLGFVDGSYTTFLNADPMAKHRSYLYVQSQGGLGLAPFKSTVGLGTRIYMRQIVLPLLGLDVGYGLERGDYEIYFAVGLTDL